MSILYAPAPEVAAMAARIVESHYRHLATVPIYCAWTSKPDGPAGHELFGNCRRISGRPLQWLAEVLRIGENSIHRQATLGWDLPPEQMPLFAVEGGFMTPRWPDAPACGAFLLTMDPKTWLKCPALREPMLDHLLSHCGAFRTDDGDLKLFIRPHDVEEFTSVTKRHGQWRDANHRSEPAMAREAGA